jgi:hypothetical protein
MGAAATKGEGGSNWENDVTKMVQGLEELREEELQIETYYCLCPGKLSYTPG